MDSWSQLDLHGAAWDTYANTSPRPIEAIAAFCDASTAGTSHVRKAPVKQSATLAWLWASERDRVEALVELVKFELLRNMGSLTHVEEGRRERHEPRTPSRYSTVTPF